MEDLKKNVKKLEQDVEKLEVKLDDNVALIIKTMNKLHSHEEKINKNALKIKENSMALDILKDYKKDKKILSKICLTLVCALCITIAFLIFVLMKWVI